MQSEKEIWKDEVLNSTTGISSAEVSPFFVAKTLNRIKEYQKEISPENVFRFKLAILSLSVLLMLNLFVVYRFQSNKYNTETKSTLTSNLDLYE